MDRSAPDPAAPPPGPPLRRDLWLCLGFVVLGLLLRAPLLTRSVWFEEACVSNTRLGSFEQLLAAIYADPQPPLYATFAHLWNRLFGDGELTMRLPALLCGLAAIPATFLVGRRFVSDSAALWAALLLALAPAHIWYSTEAQLYSPMLCSALVGVGTWCRLLSEQPGRRGPWWALHLLNLGVMLTLHYHLAVFVAWLALAAPLYARGFTRPARGILASHGLGLVALGGFVAAKRNLGGFELAHGSLRPLDLGGVYDFVFDWCWTGHTLDAVPQELDQWAAWLQEALGVVVVGFGLLQILGRRRARPAGPLLPWLVVAIPAVLLVVGGGHANLFAERHCLPALPFVLLLGGAGIAALPPRIGASVGTAVLLLATAGCIALYHHRDTDRTVQAPAADWRSAAHFLAGEISTGGTGRPIYCTVPNPRALSYYEPRIQDVRNLTEPTSARKLGDQVRTQLGTWLGDAAERAFTAFAAQNRAKLDAAALRVFPVTGDPAQLDGERPADGTCYLVQDTWHSSPPNARAADNLLHDPRVTVLTTHRFAGVAVHVLRIAP